MQLVNYLINKGELIITSMYRQKTVSSRVVDTPNFN